MKLARALSFAVLCGSLSASAVATISIVGDFPRVWPGTVMSFLTSGATAFLWATRRGER